MVRVPTPPEFLALTVTSPLAVILVFFVPAALLESVISLPINAWVSLETLNNPIDTPTPVLSAVCTAPTSVTCVLASLASTSTEPPSISTPLSICAIVRLVWLSTEILPLTPNFSASPPDWASIRVKMSVLAFTLRPPISPVWIKDPSSILAFVELFMLETKAEPPNPLLALLPLKENTSLESFFLTPLTIPSILRSKLMMPVAASKVILVEAWTSTFWSLVWYAGSWLIFAPLLITALDSFSYVLTAKENATPTVGWMPPLVGSTLPLLRLVTKVFMMRSGMPSLPSSNRSLASATTLPAESSVVFLRTAGSGSSELKLNFLLGMNRNG